MRGTVRAGDTVLAELHDITVDMPWFTARLRPWAELFDEEAWEAAYERVVEVVVLVRPDGETVADFLLRIDGEEVRFRIWAEGTVPLHATPSLRTYSGVT